MEGGWLREAKDFGPLESPFGNDRSGNMDVIEDKMALQSEMDRGDNC